MLFYLPLPPVVTFSSFEHPHILNRHSYSASYSEFNSFK